MINLPTEQEITERLGDIAREVKALKAIKTLLETGASVTILSLPPFPKVIDELNALKSERQLLNKLLRIVQESAVITKL